LLRLIQQIAVVVVNYSIQHNRDPLSLFFQHPRGQVIPHYLCQEPLLPRVTHAFFLVFFVPFHQSERTAFVWNNDHSSDTQPFHWTACCCCSFFRISSSFITYPARFNCEFHRFSHFYWVICSRYRCI